MGLEQGCFTIKRFSMAIIPKSHPRAKSLQVRERLVHGFEHGLVAVEGLLAEGRGEAFDYLLGEKTRRAAKTAINAAAAQLLLAKNPVISVNGNTAALCAKEVVGLGRAVGAKIEVNLFYANEKRRQNIVKTLKKNGAKQILGTNLKNSERLLGIDSARQIIDRDGIFSADVVVIPLEDGDRAAALTKSGKKVIAFDLNPMSRTSMAADITIVDNVTRSMVLLIESCKRLSKKNAKSLERIIDGFDNKKNLSDSILEIKNHLTRRSRIA